jgi:hypothetical protein
MATIYRAVGALNLSEVVPVMSKQSKSIVQSMTNNPFFTNPINPLLATVSNHLGDLDDAEAKVELGGKSATSARNLAKKTVKRDMQQLLGFVQATADADPDQAEAIIRSAGMSVKRITVRQKNKDEARQGDVSGTVILIAMFAGRRALYQWQWSSDQKTWTNLPTTFITRTGMSGLTPGMTYAFRYQVDTRAGLNDWSQIVSILVK